MALLILRLSAATALLMYGAEHPITAWSFILLVLPASALCLGFITPYASGICCLIELSAAIRVGSQSAFPVIISIAHTAALAMLGPGAYSLDALMFGRRVVRFSAHNRSGP
jgi:hypothetical protein